MIVMSYFVAAAGSEAPRSTCKDGPAGCWPASCAACGCVSCDEDR